MDKGTGPNALKGTFIPKNHESRITVRSAQENSVPRRDLPVHGFSVKSVCRRSIPVFLDGVDSGTQTPSQMWTDCLSSWPPGLPRGSSPIHQSPTACLCIRCGSVFGLAWPCFIPPRPSPSPGASPHSLALSRVARHPGRGRPQPLESLR